MALTIANGLIVTLDPGYAIHEGGSIRIEGNLMSDVRRREDPVPPDQDFLDASSAIVVPGFLNAHTHAPETLARGTVDRCRFEDWLGAVWPALDALSPEQIRVAVLLGCAEVTCRR